MKTLRVLVPLDGSPLAEASLPFVSGLERPAVTLLRILEDASAFKSGAQSGEAEAGAELKGAAARLKALGVEDVAAEVRHGKPAQGILDAAVELQPGMLALATRGRGGAGRQAVGRVARKVLCGSRFPVLAVQPGCAPPSPGPLFSRVLVPSIGGRRSWRAVEELEVLGAGDRSRLMLFGVVEELVAGAHPGAAHHGAGETIDDPVEYFLASSCEELREKLAREARRIRDLGLQAVSEVDVGRPAPKIAERAVVEAATLIALSSRERAGLSRLVLGNLAEAILALAPVPLLFVP